VTELKRWTEDGAPKSVARLLEAAANERPTQASLAKSLSAAALGLGALAGSSSASGAALGVATKATLLGGATWFKTGVFVAGIAVVTTGGVYVATSPVPAASQPTVSTPRPSAAAPAPPAPAVSPAPEVSRAIEPWTPATASVGPTPRPAPAQLSPGAPKPALEATTPLEAADQLAEEVRWVDAARAAVAAGQGAEALRLLDGYDQRYRSRGFAPESLYLRMRALVSLGRGEEARAVASRLARSYPATPQAARARELLNDLIP
jgi:hypothetical protein